MANPQPKSAHAPNKERPGDQQSAKPPEKRKTGDLRTGQSSAKRHGTLTHIQRGNGMS